MGMIVDGEDEDNQVKFHGDHETVRLEVDDDRYVSIPVSALLDIAAYMNNALQRYNDALEEGEFQFDQE